MQKPELLKRSQLQGVGVDVVDISRVQAFVQNHSKSACARILTSQEKKVWRQKKYSARIYSKFFAAKEAFFKALGRSWMGLDGFQTMDILLLKGNRFRANFLAPNRSGGHDGHFFSIRNRWIGAQVIAWN